MSATAHFGSARGAVPVAAPPAIRTAGLGVFLIAFLSIHYLANAQIILGHLDLGWHLAAGDLIRARGEIPAQDTWSFTLGDKRWFNLSWLWDVMASIVVQYTGLAGIVVGTVACGAAIAACLVAAGLASGASTVAVGLAVLSTGLLYPTFPTDPNSYLSASPNTATMLFCAVFYVVCVRRTGFLLLPMLMVPWVNLHGGFVLGFGIVGVFGAVSVWQRDWKTVVNLAMAGALCLPAILVNPLGWHIVEGVAATLGHFVQTEISEWQPYHRVLSLPGSLPAVAYMVAFVALEVTRGRAVAMPLAPRLLAWVFLGLGLYQFRYMSFFFIFATIPTALHLDRLLPGSSDDPIFGKALLAAGVAALCALPPLFVQIRPTFALTEMLSVADARYLRDHHARSRLLNNWNVGGVLIGLTKGQVPVFIDGRAATAYPDDLLRDYLKLVTQRFDEAAWDHALAKYDIDAVLWVKAHDDLRRFLVGRRGWRESYVGMYETVYVRP